MKYAFIHQHRRLHAVSQLCSALSVSSSGYYDWLTRPESETKIANRRLLTKIRCYHQSSRQTYGSPRIHRDLIDDGEVVGVNRVARLMRGAGIQAKTAKRFAWAARSRNNAPPAANRLKRRFSTHQPNEVWVSDTTFIRTRQGWLYLAVILDLYSRQAVGWAMSNHNNTQLVVDALTMAIWRRPKAKGVILHSDQGATYASSEYQALITNKGFICSMSRKGKCHDNAVAESFFGTLKTELVDDADYQTREQAKQSLFEYIEVFYNRHRKHSYLDYVSPTEFERACAL